MIKKIRMKKQTNFSTPIKCIIFSFICVSLTIFILNRSSLYQLCKPTQKNTNYTQYGIRFLDHLEYNIPADQIPKGQEILAQNPAIVRSLEYYQPLIEAHYQAPVDVHYINDQIGYGVFALKNIQPGQMIGEYTGIVRRVNFSKQGSDYDYAWGFPKPTKYLVDAKDAGNDMRFINHSYRPNVEMIFVPDKAQRLHLIYVANQPIKKGQQLLSNYGKPYWAGRKNIPVQWLNESEE